MGYNLPFCLVVWGSVDLNGIWVSFQNDTPLPKNPISPSSREDTVVVLPLWVIDNNAGYFYYCRM